MKRFLLSSVIALLVLSIFSAGVASAAEVKAKGTLKSVDSSKGTVVFVAEGSKDEVSIKVKAEDIKGLKKGDKVTITYDKGKENTATKVKKAPGEPVHVGCG